MTASLLESLEPMILAIAAEFGRRHRVHGADHEDFAQSLRLWAWQNQATLEEWSVEKEPEDFERYVARVLRNEALDLGVDIKAQAVGYKRDDLTWYSKGELRQLLPSVFDAEKWHEPPQSDGRSVKSYAEGNNWVAILSDVSRAYDSLEKDDREILFAFHAEDHTNKMLAERQGISEQLMSYRHDKAIDRLLTALGGPRPQMRDDLWSGRRAVGNAQAAAMTKATYGDD